MKTIDLTFTVKPKQFDGVLTQGGVQEFDFTQTQHLVILNFDTDLTPGVSGGVNGILLEDGSGYILCENGDTLVQE